MLFSYKGKHFDIKKKPSHGEKSEGTARKELCMCFDYIKAYAAQLGEQMSKEAILNKRP